MTQRERSINTLGEEECDGAGKERPMGSEGRGGDRDRAKGETTSVHKENRKPPPTSVEGPSTAPIKKKGKTTQRN